MIDILVHNETASGRRVYLDYRSNPAGLIRSFDGLCSEARQYLSNSDALAVTPAERLAVMNRPAIDLFRRQGIDLYTQPLETGVCAQHHNGGLAVDEHWRTDIDGLYAAGEAAGTFGTRRPGGSALNSTQVGSLRAAEHIASRPRDFIIGDGAFAALAAQAAAVLLGDISAAVAQPDELPELFKNRDIFITQLAVLSAMRTAYGRAGSRGSALAIADHGGPLPGGMLRYLPARPPEGNQRIITRLTAGGFVSEYQPVRPIPNSEQWFETVWRGRRL